MVKRLDEQVAERDEEIARYQKSVTYLTRELDEHKLAQLDSAILEEKIRALEDEVAHKEAVVASYRRQQRSSAVQTDNGLQVELDNLRYSNHELYSSLHERDEEREQIQALLER